MQHSVRRNAIRAVVALAVALGCGESAKTPGGDLPPSSGWWRNRTFYEVFVRSFADSNGDGVGDLAGLTAHLDDLNDGDPATTTDLGVDAIWLMPIFASPSSHGYDVTDYRAIQPAYGTLADFDAFVAAAHARGIRVVLDMVLNHTSSKHPWFLDAGTGPGAAKRDWYVWSATNPGWTRPFGGGGPVWYPGGGAYYYGVFAPSMPDLNLANAAVEAELVDAMRFWLARGVDGFRLDAVRYLLETSSGALQDVPATHAFLKRIRAALAKDHPDALLVAEAWASAQTVATYYGDGDEVQLAFGFDVAEGLKTSIAGGTRGAFLTNTSVTADTLAGKDLRFLAPFVSNHDQVRALRQMDPSAVDPAAARVAAAALFALPGTPFVYYGEELGMRGGAGADDVNKRTPIRWTASAPRYGFATDPATALWCGSLATWCNAAEADGVDVATQRDDPASLWNLYRQLIALRHDTPALTGEDVAFPSVTGGGSGVVALLRTSGADRVLFLANLGKTPSGAFSVAVDGAPRTLFVEGTVAAPTTAAGALEHPGLAPRGFAFYALQ